MSGRGRKVALGLWLLLIAAECAVLAGLAASSQTGDPQRVPVAIVAPSVVGGALADQTNALDGHPFDATAATEDEAGAARRSVLDGTRVSALLVDLSGTTDTVLLNAGRDRALNDAVLERVRQIETSRGRTVTVERLGGDGRSTGPAYTLTLVTALLGFALVVALSVRSGAAAPTLRDGVRRTVFVVVVSLVAGGVLAVLWPGATGDAGTLGVAGVLGLHMAMVALVTLALESLVGLLGMAVAAASFLVLNAPLLTRTDPYLLPGFWARSDSWAPSGAARRALTALTVFDDASLLRPVVVLATWGVIAVAVLLGARWLRARMPGASDVEQVNRVGTPRGWRVLVAVAPAAALLLAAGLLVPEGGSALGALPSRASATDCLATGRLQTVADLNRVAGRLRGTGAFQGGDVGADVLLQDGRRLWVFGDTLRGSGYDGESFVRNSMLVIDPGCLSVVLPADGGAIIPDRAASASGGEPVGYWPMSVSRLARPGYDLVDIATQRVRTTGTGAFDFENLGTSIAVFVVARGETPQLVAQRDIGPDATDSLRPTWGAASAVVQGDGGPWVYLYGTARPDDDQTFGYSLSVARVRPDDIVDASRWRYWDGDRWSARAGSAAVLIPAQGGVSQTLSVFEQDGTWYALSKQDEFLGTNLTVWTAPSPTGPFTPQPPLAQLPSDTVTGLLRYMPLAHPDLLPRPGTMVVSYSRNRTDLGEVLKDPLLYRPRFLRVRLP